MAEKDLQGAALGAVLKVDPEDFFAKALLGFRSAGWRLPFKTTRSCNPVTPQYRNPVPQRICNKIPIRTSISRIPTEGPVVFNHKGRDGGSMS
jgi:hypothetical protein